MESEDRQNSLSKDKAIEQLRTTVDKLETIIERLNAASVVDLPSAEPVVALVTTTEQLENTISNLPEDTVAPESQTTSISNEKLQDSPEVAAVYSIEQPSVSESKPLELESANQPPIIPELDKTEATAQQEIPQSVTTAQTQPTRPKKKKNWLAIAIIALILAIIPISLKYLPIEKTTQFLSEKVEEIVREGTTLIATNLPDNKLPKKQEISVINQKIEPIEDISLSELPHSEIDTIELIEAPEQQMEPIEKEVIEVSLVEETESIASEITDSDQPKLLLEEETESILTSQSDIEASIVNNEVAEIALDIPEVFEVIEEEPEIALVEETESTASEINDSDQPELLLEEEAESIATSQPDVEVSIVNNEVTEIASDIPEVVEFEVDEVEVDEVKVAEVVEVGELESQLNSEATANIDETIKIDKNKTAKIDEAAMDEIAIDKTVDLEIDNIPESIIETEPKIVFPENLVASGTEQLLELKTVIHDIKLTPEQDLIAALSAQVLQLSEGYQEDIVLSIEPNMSNNILIVRVADDWYQLEATEQDEIVADMLARSQDLEFRKLEITDQNNNLVARSPVVGQNMIIFRRNFLTQTSNS
ncbi:MAG: hypothetical protein AAGA80_03985 [Cyanobacteria bacterium P01_F01_bin.143]